MTHQVMLKNNAGGLFVLELCTSADDLQILSEDCFTRLDVVDFPNSWTPLLQDEPQRAWVMSSYECFDDHLTEKDAFLYRFKIPTNASPGRAVLRWFWQMQNSCCPHEYLSSKTFNADLEAWKKVDNLDGDRTCAVYPCNSGLTSCGVDCPSTNCYYQWGHIKNCADVEIRSASDRCTQSNNDCTLITSATAEVVAFPGDCSILYYGLGRCSEVTSVSGTEADNQLCLQLCQDVHFSVEAKAWCRFAAFCSLDNCIASYSNGKCKVREDSGLTL
eukprot:Blabericola_migrator_1__1540@NODE_1407_length_4613_cov_55_511659_g204_i1_p2_GENE_NODE_1407_length_4613_cov_55_511659_g204_i1NODE_1407_length_4613_cov_55_511659_g204_i1_p2_ORF_typecomplete_len274_score24_19_NODE_1407_length_4613_cov_55_511659_g204_i122053026